MIIIASKSKVRSANLDVVSDTSASYEYCSVAKRVDDGGIIRGVGSRLPDGGVVAIRADDVEFSSVKTDEAV